MSDPAPIAGVAISLEDADQIARMVLRILLTVPSHALSSSRFHFYFSVYAEGPRCWIFCSSASASGVCARGFITLYFLTPHLLLYILSPCYYGDFVVAVTDVSNHGSTTSR